MMPPPPKQHEMTMSRVSSTGQSFCHLDRKKEKKKKKKNIEVLYSLNTTILRNMTEVAGCPF